MKFKYYGFSTNINMLSMGNNLIFVKILNEFKNEILTSIKEFENEKGLKMLSTIQGFQKGSLHSTEMNMFIVDILVLLEQNFHIDYTNLPATINQNVSKEYLYKNFATWWYQSLYFMKGAGYIKNINDYCQRFLTISKNMYTEEEVSNILQKSFHMTTVPYIFSKEELQKLEKFHKAQ